MNSTPPIDESVTRRYLRRLVILRVQLVIVLLLLVSLVSFAVDYVAAVQGWAWSRNVPFREVAAATLSTGIIGVVWEWFIRGDASEQLRRTLLEIGEQQRPALAHEVASAVMRDDRLLNSLVSNDNADRVLRASLASATGNRELADGLRRALIDRVLAGEDYWENYRARIYVTDSTDLVEHEGVDTFFDLTVEIRYEALLRKSVFRFGVSTSRATTEEMNADRAFDGSWFIARSTGNVDSPMQRVRLDTAHAHILLSDTATRTDGLAILDATAQLARQYGLMHQVRSIHGIRQQEVRQ